VWGGGERKMEHRREADAQLTRRREKNRGKIERVQANVQVQHSVTTVAVQRRDL
jgi:hypothetical protein